MLLIPVSKRPDAVQILWDLLAERTPEQSISHKAMPTWEEHAAFVDRMDTKEGDLYARYAEWRLIEVDGEIVGSIYVTQRDEIGISIFKAHQRKGYGSAAVRTFMKWYGCDQYLANINPANEASRKMWEKLGFKKIQETYSLNAD